MNIQQRQINNFFSKFILVFAAILLLWLSVGANLSGQNAYASKNSHISKAIITALVADSLDKQTGLIIAPGYALVKQNCIRCHSPKIITDKRATREGWLATIRWMQQNQGLWDLGKAEPEILDYLATHYAPTNEGRRPPLKNVQWYKLQ